MNENIMWTQEILVGEKKIVDDASTHLNCVHSFALVIGRNENE